MLFKHHFKKRRQIESWTLSSGNGTQRFVYGGATKGEGRQLFGGEKVDGVPLGEDVEKIMFQPFAVKRDHQVEAIQFKICVQSPPTPLWNRCRRIVSPHDLNRHGAFSGLTNFVSISLLVPFCSAMETGT